MINRRGHGSGLPGEAQAAAPQHVGHSPGDFQLGTRWQIQQVIKLHDRRRRPIAEADTPVRRPACFVVAVDQMYDGVPIEQYTR